MTMIVLLFFVPILVGILLLLNVLLAVHRSDSEKVSPYECGFSPIYGQVRAPFAIQYYLVGILFLIFDLEIAVLFPVAVTLYQVTNYGFWIATIFLVLLTVGFVYEWGTGALKFTDHRSSINRNVITDEPQSPLVTYLPFSSTVRAQIQLKSYYSTVTVIWLMSVISINPVSI